MAIVSDTTVVIPSGGTVQVAAPNYSRLSLIISCLTSGTKVVARSTPDNGVFGYPLNESSRLELNSVENPGMVQSGWFATNNDVAAMTVWVCESIDVDASRMRIAQLESKVGVLRELILKRLRA